MPRPAKNVKNCKISMLEKNGTVPTLNLFKQKRCKGWWPLAAKDEEGARLVVSRTNSDKKYNLGLISFLIVRFARTVHNVLAMLAVNKEILKEGMFLHWLL